VDGLEELRSAAVADQLIPVDQVVAILALGRRGGSSFEAAWFSALRAIRPPRSCGPPLRSAADETLVLLREVKPHFRAAYERRVPTRAELGKADRLANRRLNRLLSVEQTEIAA
jgi:hypothetical protein